jgi:hypothetical protein
MVTSSPDPTGTTDGGEPSRFFPLKSRSRGASGKQQTPKNSSVFRDITPCILLEMNRRFGRDCRLHLQLYLPATFTLAHSCTLKVEATCSSEGLVASQRCTRRCAPEGTTVRDPRCEFVKSATDALGLHTREQVQERRKEKGAIQQKENQEGRKD